MDTLNDTVWNRIFHDNETILRDVHPALPGLAALFQRKQTGEILDLGSGRGRHVVYLARRGFAPSGFDNAFHGLNQTQRWLENEGLHARLVLGDIYRPLPFPDARFDAVISFQVIHHAPLQFVRQCVGEIARVLRPGGLVFISVPHVKSNHKFNSEEIEPNTFVPSDGMEKGLPHHIFSPAELKETFSGFIVHGILMIEPHHLALFAEKP